MLASALELLASVSELHCTGSHICHLDWLGMVDYIVFVSEICNVCANLPQVKSQSVSGEISIFFSQQGIQNYCRQIQYRLNRNIVIPWCTHIGVTASGITTAPPDTITLTVGPPPAPSHAHPLSVPHPTVPCSTGPP